MYMAAMHAPAPPTDCLHLHLLAAKARAGYSIATRNLRMHFSKQLCRGSFNWEIYVVDLDSGSAPLQR